LSSGEDDWVGRFCASRRRGGLVSDDGGCAVPQMSLAAAGRFVANATGIATSPAGVKQFIFDTDDRVLLWDADGGTLFQSPVRIVGLEGGGTDSAAADLRIIA
jgi:hypothetical protein